MSVAPRHSAFCAKTGPLGIFRQALNNLFFLILASAYFQLDLSAFDFNGKTDIVWQQRQTGETAVWMMDFARYTSVALITNDFGRGWEIAATADFNRDGDTDLLWRNFVTGENQIALMHGTNRWARMSITPGSTNFYVVGTGDFNGDGYPDILWNYRDNQRAGIWFMMDGKWTDQLAWLPNREGKDWWPVATGDFNGDSQSDIVFRNQRSGRNALWLMDRTNFLARVELPSEPDLGNQLVATGQFNPVGNTDLLWRHTNGQNSIWLLNGTQFLSKVFLPTETNAFWTVRGTGGYTNGMMLSATAAGSPPSLILTRRFGATNGATIKRKLPAESTWSTQAVNYLPHRFTNSDLIAGQRYQFDVSGQYLLAGVHAAPVEHRGIVILVVDQTIARPLDGELELLQTDLIGDGWSVIRTNVSRHNDRTWSANTNAIAMIRRFIRGVYQSQPAEAKAVFLLGHVPIPYAGFHNPDGHGSRALPTDGFYGDVDGIYSDTNVNFHTFMDPPERRHGNLLGDGKWDQNRYPKNAEGIARLELGVGRVDFAKMPDLAPLKEVDLLRQYLGKDHRYRHKQFTLPERIAVGTFFPTGLNREAYANALKIGSRLFGIESGRVIDVDPLAATNAALWAIHGGYGLPYGIRGDRSHYHEAREVCKPASEPRAAFGAFYGSYLVDFDYTNNFMRAFLGTPNYGLAAMWFRPVATLNIPLNFEELGSGETLGSGFLRSINENPESAADNIYINLLGDPTLRMQVLAPPSGLSARTGDTVTLQWTASTDSGAQYFVYRSTRHFTGPWTKLTLTPVDRPAYIDSSPPSGPKLYQVRAAKLIFTGSGSFTNLSQGIFVKVGQSLSQ